MTRALNALAKVRNLALNTAKRDLATAIGHEAATLADLRAIERTITAESAIAQASIPSDGQQTFSAWLALARTRRRNLLQAHRDAAAGTSLARAKLTQAHADLRIAQELLQRQADARKREQAQAQQRALDEIAARNATPAKP
jgi:flagellar export protein FliJ